MNYNDSIWYWVHNVMDIYKLNPGSFDLYKLFKDRGCRVSITILLDEYQSYLAKEDLLFNLVSCENDIYFGHLDK